MRPLQDRPDQPTNVSHLLERSFVYLSSSFFSFLEIDKAIDIHDVLTCRDQVWNALFGLHLQSTAFAGAAVILLLIILYYYRCNWMPSTTHSCWRRTGFCFVWLSVAGCIKKECIKRLIKNVNRKVASKNCPKKLFLHTSYATY